MTRRTAPEPKESPTRSANASTASAGAVPSTRRLPGRRVGTVLASLVVLLVGLFYLAGGWYFSSLIYSETLEVKRSSPATFEVTDVTPRTPETGSVTLRMGADAATRPDTDALTGLSWAGGYVQTSPATFVGGDLVTRDYTVAIGTAPRVGDVVELDGYYFPEDPTVGLGVPFQSVTLTSSLATFPAWYVPGSPGESTWTIFVHGKGASRQETLRSMQIVVQRDFPMLAITYRNDPAEVVSPDERYGYGINEYEEVVGAVRYAVDHGAAHVVLFGYSMGGAATLKFLYDDPLAAVVSATVLDSPVSSLGDVLDLRADERTLPILGLPVPESLESVAMWMSERRFGVSFGDLDYVARADELRAPVLLIQGLADPTVPHQVNDALAAANPNLITYEQFARASHVRAWNSERARYEDVVATFLDRAVPTTR